MIFDYAQNVRSIDLMKRLWRDFVLFIHKIGRFDEHKTWSSWDVGQWEIQLHFLRVCTHECVPGGVHRLRLQGQTHQARLSRKVYFKIRCYPLNWYSIISRQSEHLYRFQWY